MPSCAFKKSYNNPRNKKGKDISFHSHRHFSCPRCLNEKIMATKKKPYKVFYNKKAREASTNWQECPVCTEVMCAPIFQCKTGHSLCNTCTKSLQSPLCPICREQMLQMRNFAVEKAPVPCPNKSSGCVFILTTEDVDDHVKECIFRAMNCPLAVFGKCSWNGQLTEMMLHFKDRHPNHCNFTSGDEAMIPSISVNEDERIVLLVNKGKLFFVVTVKIDTLQKMSYWTIQHIGSKKVAQQHVYEFHITSQLDNRRKAVFTDHCFNDNMKTEEIFQMGKCGMLPLEALANYIKDNILKFRFLINRNTYGKQNNQNPPAPKQNQNDRNPQSWKGKQNECNPHGPKGRQNSPYPHGSKENQDISNPHGWNGKQSVSYSHGSKGNQDDRNLPGPKEKQNDINTHGPNGKLTFVPMGNQEGCNTRGPMGKQAERNAYSPMGKQEERNAYSPMGKQAERNAYSPMVKQEERNAYSPMGKQAERNAYSPMGKQAERNAYSPMGQQEERNAYAPMEKMEERNAHVPMGAQKERNAYGPIKECNVYGPVGNMEERNAYGPMEERNAYGPMEKMEVRNAYGPMGQQAERNAYGPIGQKAERNAYGPMGQKAERNSPGPMGKREKRNAYDPNVTQEDLSTFVAVEKLEMEKGEQNNPNSCGPNEKQDNANIYVQRGQAGGHNTHYNGTKGAEPTRRNKPKRGDDICVIA